MILSQEALMDLRRFKALAEAGATWAEIARESGHDWRTVKRYLATGAPATPPAPAKRGPGPRLIDPYSHLADGWLRKTAEAQGQRDLGAAGHRARLLWPLPAGQGLCPGAPGPPDPSGTRTGGLPPAL
jgi:hypothetical protein